MSFTQGLPASLYVPLLKQPLSSESHSTLAQTLWSQGQTSLAKHEATLAQDLEGGVLGTSTSTTALLTQWETEPAKIAQDLEHWKLVTQQKPDYRDGFIMAAAAAYKLGKLSEAEKYINDALALDPTSTTAQELRSIIKAP
jgi:hypothetical protein